MLLPIVGYLKSRSKFGGLREVGVGDEWLKPERHLGAFKSRPCIVFLYSFRFYLLRTVSLLLLSCNCTGYTWISLFHEYLEG